jgi:predicted ATPase/class 3 adenylate cyclase
MTTLPSGTVTYVMTDVVGSTSMWELCPDEMAFALRRHDAIAKECADRRHGHVVKERGEGDSLFLVFHLPTDAAAAAIDLQTGILAEQWHADTQIRLRIAIHTGDSEVRDSDYYGPAINRCARLRSVAWGGQILVSSTTHELIIGRLPAGSDLRDLGVHRLRDLSRPERISELIYPAAEHTDRPIRSLNSIRHNLPVYLTSFEGREDDVTKVCQHLQRYRLVTITGSGGCGKTRLSLQVASDVADRFPGGVWFIDLTKVGMGDSIDELIAKEMNLSVGSTDIGGHISTSIGHQPALLVLDNCEHVVDAAARFAASLLHSSEYVSILATSREALKLAGEARWRVPSLSVPHHHASLAQIRQADSVRLFTERVKLRSPEFNITESNKEEVVRLCRLLDGIPLAIEQAASNASTMSPAQMVQRFTRRLEELGIDDRGVVPRHQTLAATMDWSYAMLSDDERLLLQRCSAFSGGWSTESAEAICSGEGLPSEKIASVLRRLQDKSQIFIEDGRGHALRYRMLRVVQEYTSRLGDIDMYRDRHARHFVDLGARESAAQNFASCEAEFENIVAGLDRLLEACDPAGIEGVMGLRFFFDRYGHYSTARRFMQTIVDSGPDEVLLATCLNVIGIMSWRVHDMDRAVDAMERGLAIWKRIGDRSQAAAVLTNLALVAAASDELGRATDLLRQSLEIYRDIADEVGIVRVEMNLGAVLNQAEQYEAAIDLTTRTLDRLASIGDTSRTALARGNRALAFLETGRTRQAIDDLGQGLALLSREYSANALHWTVCVMANAAHRTNNDDLAERLATLHDAIRVESGVAVAAEETRLLSGIATRQPLDSAVPLNREETFEEICTIRRELSERLSGDSPCSCN